MAKKRSEDTKKKRTTALDDNIEIADAGIVLQNRITETLEKNYMPYAMSVIISRALPEIDGLKPSHRKLLYTMYDMGLLKGARTKSANIVGTTMRLNPHGDGPIYETMVRLSTGNEALLNPFVSSKGNFGKFYSRDMAYAASRYTEAKLAPVAELLFRDIDKDTVDFIPNYDNTRTEPTLLPVCYPNILTNCTIGIAVGMASSICSFNLAEICDTTIALIKDANHPIETTLHSADFVGGGQILHNADELANIYETGRGSIRVRSRYEYIKDGNRIEITQIPYSTTIEAIMDKISELVKSGKVKEISDMRDETDLGGLMLTLDLKRGVDPEKLMNRLFAMTPLEDSFSCNFNIIIGGTPRTMGVREILTEWIAFRLLSVKRRTYFLAGEKKKRLHLLLGLKAILLDIDKAVKIVRETEDEEDVVPNLMIGFGIDKIQAEYVAEIRLRQLNRNYILRRTEEVDKLRDDIYDLEELLENKKKLLKVICDELKEVKDKYGIPRRSEILYSVLPATVKDEVQEIPDYPVTVFFTEENYIKKITAQSLRMSGEQKLKEGDSIRHSEETKNNAELLFFTNKAQVYKCFADQFDDTKASVIGDYLPAALNFEEEELCKFMAVVEQYVGFMIFVFEDGRIAKVDITAYQTKLNRKKLINAFNNKCETVKFLYLKEDADISIETTAGRMLIINSAQLTVKTTKNTQGVQVVKLRKGIQINNVSLFTDEGVPDAYRYRVRNLPSTGQIIKTDQSEQLTL